MGWPLDGMAQEQLFEDLERLVLAGPFLDQLLHHVVHDLHEAGHFLLREVLLLGKVAIEVSELLQNAHLCRALQSAVQLLKDLCM